MPTKFYFRRTTQTITGTAPATNATTSAKTPTWTPGASNSVVSTPLLTNYSLSPIIGSTAQTTLAYTTDNVTTNQQQPLLRFVSTPLLAQVINAQAITVRLGLSQSSTVSAFTTLAVVTVWRPSTGTVVGRFSDGTVSSPQPGTSQTDISNSIASGSTSIVACQDGDLLVVEIWRGVGLQTMGTSYTNTIAYDGRTEGSTSDNAGYIQFTTSVVLQSDLPNTAPQGPADTFSDNAINTGLWGAWGTGTQVEGGGVLTQGATGVGGEWVGIVSNSTYNFTNRSLVAQISQFPNVAQYNLCVLRAELDANNAYILAYDNGNLAVQWQHSGITDTSGTPAAVPPGTIGLKIVFDDAGGGRVWWCSTTDGINWKVLGHNTGYTTAWTALKVVLSAGCISGVASPGTVKWESTGVTVGTFENLTGAAAGRATANLAVDEYGVAIKATNGLVAYWRLNEAAGPTAYDAESGYHGTYVGGQYNVYYQAAGAPSDGKDKAVMLGGGWIDLPDIVINSAFTVEMWVKLIFFSPSGVLINRRTVGNVGGFSLEFTGNTDGTLSFHVYDTGWKTATTWRPLASDQWHHIVARYDAAGGMSVIINGSSEATASVGTLNNPAGAALQIARAVINGGLLTDPDWTAPFDEFAIYNVHLSQATIQQHYRLGVKARDTYGQLIEGTSGLVAYWRAHETGTANLFDEAGNGWTLRANPNGVTQNVPGIVQDTPSIALQMDGTTSATIDSASTFTGLDFAAGDFTVEGWFYRDAATSGPMPIIEWNTTDGATYGAHCWLYDSSDKIYANFYDIGGGDHIIQSGSGVVSGGAWHYVVLQRQGNTGRLYLDNVLVGTTSLTGLTLKTNQPFNLGWRGPSYPANFKGKLGHFAAYNVALTTTQIDQRWALFGLQPGQVPSSTSAGKATCVGVVDKGALPTQAVGPVDQFNIDGYLDPQWTGGGTLGTRSVSAGVLNLGAPISTPSGQCNILSTSNYNLSDRIVYTEIVTRSAQISASTTGLRVEDSGASNWSFELQMNSTYLMAIATEAGVGVFTPFVSWPAGLRFLRMLFDPTAGGHRVYFQYSTDGITWTTLGSYFSSRSLTSWKVGLRSGAGNIPAPGVAQYDNFNFPAWTYKNLTGTSNGSSVAAAPTLTRAKAVAPVTGGVGGATAVGMLSRRNDRVAYPIQIRQVIPVEYSGASISSVSFPIPLAVAPGGHLIGIWFNGTANPGSEGALYKWGALKTQGSYSGTAALLKTSGYTYDRSAQVTASPVSSVMANRYWGTGVSVVYTNYSTFTAIRGVILEVVGLQKDTNAPWTAVASNYGNNTTMTVTAPNAQNTPAVAALAVVVDMSITAGRTYNVSPANWTRQYSYPDGTATLPSGAIEWNQDINILNPPSLTASWVTPATAWYVALNLYLKGIAPGLVGATNGRATDVAAIYGTGTPKTIFTSANTNPSNGVSACVGQPSSRPRSTVLGGPTADTFTSGTLDPQWTYFGTPGVQNVSGGTLNLGVPTSTAASIGVQSTNTSYDLTGKMIVAEIFARPATASGSKTWLKITNAQPTIYGIWIGSSGSNLVAEGNFGNTNVQLLASMAWPAGLRAVRIIAEPCGQSGTAPGNVESTRWIFEYTIDGVRWITLYQERRIAGGITATSARVYIAAECTTPIGGPGTAQWDNFNVIPFPWVSYKDLTGSANGRVLDYRAVILSDTPVGYWRLNETAGTSAADSSGNNNTGTLAGSYSIGQSGATKNDYAFTLNGGVVNVADSASLHTLGATGGWSMEAWIKPTALTGIQEFYRKDIEYFFRSNGSDFQSFWRFVGGATLQPQGGTIPSTTAWTHVVATYDNANIKHYINGVLVYTLAETRTLQFGVAPLSIGAQSSGGGEFLNGGIDEVAVYNYALTLPQIQTHYAAAGYGGVVSKQPWLTGASVGFGGPRKLYNTIVTADGPLLYWKLDETTGYVAADASGSNRTGTITGKVGYSSPPGIGEGTSFDFLGTSLVSHTISGWTGGAGDAGPPPGIILPNPTGSIMRSPGYTGTTFNAPGIWRWYPNAKVDVNNGGDAATPFGEFVAWNLTKNAICNNYPPGGSGGSANGHFQPNMFGTSYVANYTQTGRSIDFYWNGTDSIELRMTRNGTSTVRVFTMTDGWLQSPGWILGPYHTIFNNNAWTVECWVKGVYVAGKYYGILMCADTWGTNSKALHILIRDRKPYMGFYSDDFDTNTVISDNVWHHLVFTYSGSVTKRQEIYIDGVRVGTGRLASTGLLVTSGAYTSWAGQPGFWLSKSQWDYNPGFMDELAIYNYALTAGQAQAHYAVGPVTPTQIGISLGTHTYLDTFDRADSDTVGGLWSETIGDWDVVNNGLRSMGGASDQLILNSTLIGTADYKVVTSVTPGDMWNGSRGVGVIARWVDVNNFYMAWCDGFDDTIKLYRGGFTQIGTYTPVPIPPSPFTLGLSVNKSTIEVELNGVVVISTTDATHTAEGDFGLRTWDAVDFQDHLFNYLYVDALTLPGQIPSASSSGGSSTTAALSTKKRLTTATAGVASVTAVIYRKKAMVVASAGVATVSVAISRRRTIPTVLSAGVATEVGQPARYFYFTVSSTNGKATTVGTVIKTAGTIASGGATAGVAVASATVRARRSMVVSSQGTAVTNTATILRRRALVAVSAGVAIEVGQPTAKRLLTVASAGVAVEVGQPTTRKSLGIRSSNGVAVTTATITRRKSLVVTAAGTSAVTGQILIRTTKVDGTANGVAIANATAITRRRPVPLTSAAGVATVTSALTRLRAITAASAGKATTTATATRRRPVVATAVGVATCSGVTTRRRRILGATVGVATTNAVAILRYRALAGVSDGESVANGPIIGRYRRLTANATGVANCRGRVVNVAIILWNGSTFALTGNYPVVLWNEEEFLLEGPEDLDLVAYRESTDQFNRVP